MKVLFIQLNNQALGSTVASGISSNFDVVCNDTENT